MSQKFLTDIELEAGLKDNSNGLGASGQVLSSTGSGVSWIDQSGGTSGVLSITVKNISGGTLTAGTAVCATSPSQNPPQGIVVEVIAADYDNIDDMPAIGILKEDLNNAAEGEAVMMGSVTNINTNSFNISDELYVGENGALVNSRPTTAGQFIQKIAVVVKKSSSNGVIKVIGAGRSNDVPLPLYIDNTNQRVGISEPTPDYALHVNGQIYSESDNYPVYYLKRNTSATGGSFSTLTGIASAFKLETDSSGTITDGFGGGIIFSIGDTSPNTAARIYARRDGGDQTGALQFWGGADGTTLFTTMRASGNVGIGTESPAEKLVVSETRSGTDAAAQTKYTLVSRSTIAPNQTPGTGGIKVVYDDGSNEHAFGLVSGSSSADFLTTGPMHFYTNSDLNTNSATGYAMMIGTDQNVVIGSTQSTTSRLFVDSGSSTALSLKSSSPKIELINTNTTTQSLTTILATAGGGGTSPPKGQIQWRGPSSSNNQGLYLQAYNTSSPYTTAQIYLPVANNNGNFHIKLNNLNALEIDPSTQDVGINQYIYHLGDDNTKFGFVANDNFAITTSGAERVRVTSGGSVGIGTSSPSSKLEIVDDLSAASTVEYPLTLSVKDDNNSINQLGGEGVGIKFKIAGNNATDPGNSFVGAGIAAVRETTSDTDSSTALAFSVSQNDETLDEVVRIDHDGNVGILETDPAHPLHITKNLNGISEASSQLKIAYNSTYNLAISHRGYFFGPSNNDYRFNRGTDTQMVIVGDSNNSNYGYVGLGTTNPDQKLHVNNGFLKVQPPEISGTTPPSITISSLTNQYQSGMESSGHLTMKSGSNSNFYWYKGSTSIMYYTDALYVNKLVDKDSTDYYLDPGSTTTSLKVAGNIEHSGLTMTDGTDIDQLKTVNMTFQLTADTWTDTGINYNDLSTGTYAVQVYVDDHTVNGGHYDEYYSGMMSWLGNSTTNSTVVDEIPLHRAGHAPNAGDIQLRTQRHSVSAGIHLMLQIKHSLTYTAALNNTDGKRMTFKFRRLI
jgi:hypothetical protein